MKESILLDTTRKQTKTGGDLAIIDLKAGDLDDLNKRQLV